MILQLHVKDAAYRFLWLKHVVGFDPRVHCARCLKGEYEKMIPYGRILPGTRVEKQLTTDAPFLYLCGVTSKYAENLHIAFVPDGPQSVFYEDAHIEVTLTGARQVPISPLPDAVQDTLTPPFTRCRNYQFGWHYLGEGAGT